MTENLLKTMAGEAAHAEAFAFGIYTIYASLLREKGMVEGAMKLEELAANEKEHMEQWLKKMDMLGEPYDLMSRVVSMEKHDANSMYSRYLEMAQRNGAPENVIEMLQHLIQIEARHSSLIQDLIEIYQGKMTKADVEEQHRGKWVCPHCGNFYYSKDDIPDKCPVCEHDKADYVWQEA